MGLQISVTKILVSLFNQTNQNCYIQMSIFLTAGEALRRLITENI